MGWLGLLCWHRCLFAFHLAPEALLAERRPFQHLMPEVVPVGGELPQWELAQHTTSEVDLRLKRLPTGCVSTRPRPMLAHVARSLNVEVGQARPPIT